MGRLYSASSFGYKKLVGAKQEVANTTGNSLENNGNIVKQKVDISVLLAC